VFNLTYEFKLKPTKNQVAIFEDWLEQNRRVYNYALVERRDWFRSRSCQINACSLRSEYIIPADAPRPTFANQCKSLTAYRKTSPNLKRVHSQVLQQTLRRLEKAFVNMWEQGQLEDLQPWDTRSRCFPRVNSLESLRRKNHPSYRGVSVKRDRTLTCQGSSPSY